MVICQSFPLDKKTAFDGCSSLFDAVLSREAVMSTLASSLFMFMSSSFVFSAQSFICSQRK